VILGRWTAVAALFVLFQKNYSIVVFGVKFFVQKSARFVESGANALWRCSRDAEHDRQWLGFCRVRDALLKDNGFHWTGKLHFLLRVAMLQLQGAMPAQADECFSLVGQVLSDVARRKSVVDDDSSLRRAGLWQVLVVNEQREWPLIDSCRCARFCPWSLVQMSLLLERECLYTITRFIKKKDARGDYSYLNASIGFFAAAFFAG
jgi:hypothetical protein